MAIQNKKLNIQELDFNEIRNNLITFFSGQDTFKDYNYDGSALSVLIDVLAYNTHYNAMYTNLAINEMFLDSASKRSSIVSIANNFGYLPDSAHCGSAILSVYVRANTAQDESVITIPKYSKFNSVKDGTNYIFYTIEDYIANLQYITSAGTYGYIFPEVKIYEGNPIEYQFICSFENQSFIIPNKNIDFNTLSIIVQESPETTTYTTYQKAEKIYNLTDTSKVFFLKELDDERYELSFGKNGFGSPIGIGNIITVMALETIGKTATDDIHLFTLITGIENTIYPPVLTTLQRTLGGSDKESVDNIKNNVTKFYFNQNRAVTSDDFAAIIARYYSNIDSINVWGGEEQNPPEYGKVFISIKPSSGTTLNNSQMNAIRALIQPYMMMATIAEFVNPKYINLSLTVDVYYNSKETIRSSDSLTSDILQQIQIYREEELKKFSGIFRYSKLSSLIDNLDGSIKSNLIGLLMRITIDPYIGSYSDYTIELNNPIYTTGTATNAILSTGFYLDLTETVYYIDDDGIGNLRLFKYNTNKVSKTIVNPQIGHVDYASGTIAIDNLLLTRIEGTSWTFSIKPGINDISSNKDYIVDIPNDSITIRMLPVPMSTKR